MDKEFKIIYTNFIKAELIDYKKEIYYIKKDGSKMGRKLCDAGIDAVILKHKNIIRAVDEKFMDDVIYRMYKIARNIQI